ncbi:nif-specific transcriptional activator NifA [Pectobacterium cacticida]|uniref:Nif-specific regulatory protein n=1 Tax=Pectobacterium cacticida TaxID=69221 RepID=A0ABZ2G768_9GAMM|nr:nif-specific transcriptional activator NifA [Pectobacterium cacticida]UYX05431.1 nif-specific transcriptional activator NifA [Pectobacterium cacticida]
MTQLPTADPVIRRFDLSAQFTALYRISVALSQESNTGRALAAILEVLHDHAFMQYGMVCLFDKERNALFVESLHGIDGERKKETRHVRYRMGEGVIGAVMSQRQSLVLPRISDDQRFLDRLNIYDYSLPLIGVPIPGADNLPAGVLVAQPMALHEDRLTASTRFLEMVANLISQPLRFATPPESLPAQTPVRCSAPRQFGFDQMVGKSQAMRQTMDILRQVSKWDTTVLVRGESGTGKELIANAIHYNSPRAAAPFVKFNCAALPDNLLESELFGHEKGAFTGAIRTRKGRFELADGGTLFLDEIGESSASFQAKLLRILQEGEMERVGGDTTLKVDVRIIAATNRNLEEEVRAGNFREDLYYRLNVMPVSLPALRERLDDIAELAPFLVKKIALRQGRDLRISDGAVRLLMTYSWPGNVRELENCLERASVMTDEGLIDRDVILFNHHESPALSAKPRPPVAADESWLDQDLDERQRVIAALEKTGWVQAKAARLLGMTPRQIAYRIQIMDINMHRI